MDEVCFQRSHLPAELLLIGTFSVFCQQQRLEGDLHVRGHVSCDLLCQSTLVPPPATQRSQLVPGADLTKYRPRACLPEGVAFCFCFGLILVQRNDLLLNSMQMKACRAPLNPSPAFIHDALIRLTFSQTQSKHLCSCVHHRSPDKCSINLCCQSLPAFSVSQ